jgi:diadenosine tetraphosphatase ApaH/serine/threonine PP2A family protein phosphatase
VKYALLADVHSNLEALTACLAHAEAQGVERWAFLGDLVGYGPDPRAVLDIVLAYTATGAAAVLGNHDAAVLSESTAHMHESARRVIDWTRRKLSDSHRAFLRSLPLTVREHDILFVHASAAAPDQWIYVTDPLRAAHSLAAACATYVFGGHVHEPVLYYQGSDARPQPFQPTPAVPIPVPRHRRWLAIVGSCGQPRDGQPLSSYAILDTVSAELTFFRLAYDYASTARKVRAAGLPEQIAERFESAR